MLVSSCTSDGEESKLDVGGRELLRKKDRSFPTN